MDSLNKHSKFYGSIIMTDDQSLKKEQSTNPNNNKKPTAGCDWIHELSVTIRKPKRVDIPEERYVIF